MHGYCQLYKDLCNWNTVKLVMINSVWLWFRDVHVFALALGNTHSVFENIQMASQMVDNFDFFISQTDTNGVVLMKMGTWQIMLKLNRFYHSVNIKWHSFKLEGAFLFTG